MHYKNSNSLMNVIWEEESYKKHYRIMLASGIVMACMAKVIMHCYCNRGDTITRIQSKLITQQEFYFG